MGKGRDGQVARKGYLLGYGHMAAACYSIMCKEPGHPTSIQLREKGVKHSRLWHSDISEDIALFIQSRGNTLHGFGAGQSWLELIDLAGSIQLKFQAYRDENESNLSALPSEGPNSWENTYFRWICERWGEFESWNQFDLTKILFNCFTKRQIWNSIAADTNTRCNFHDAKFQGKHPKVIGSWHQFIEHL